MKSSDTRKCPKCSSVNTVKNGFARPWRGGVRRRVQQYRCNNCGRNFRDKDKKRNG